MEVKLHIRVLGVNSLSHLCHLDVCEKTFAAVLYGFPLSYI